MIGLFKMPLSICQSGQKEIQNVFPVIGWVQYWPRTRILVLLCRRCLLGLNYICSTHYTQQQKCWNTVMKRGTFSEKIWTLPPPTPPIKFGFFCCLLLAIFSGGGVSFSPLQNRGGVSKNFFQSFGSQFGLKIRGDGPLPWIHHWFLNVRDAVCSISTLFLRG